MAPARLLSEEAENVTDYVTHKRRKLEIRHKNMPDQDYESEKEGLDDKAATLERQIADKHEEDDETNTAIVSHPYNIRPSGNAYTASRDIKAFTGSFAVLPDELILHLLEYLDAIDLVRLGSSCKALYAFCRAEDLWKTLFIEYVSIISPSLSPSAESLCQTSSSHTILLAGFLALHTSCSTIKPANHHPMHRSLQ